MGRAVGSSQPPELQQRGESPGGSPRDAVSSARGPAPLPLLTWTRPRSALLVFTLCEK